MMHSAGPCYTAQGRLFPALLTFACVTCCAQDARSNEAARPNVLVVIADDWSFGHAGVYGCKWVNTPTFDRVCREGVAFNHCFTSNPKCFPSRASILSG